jgi:hypothetical protein
MGSHLTSKHMILLGLLLDSVATSSAYWQLMMNFQLSGLQLENKLSYCFQRGGGDFSTNSKNYFKQAVHFWESKHFKRDDDDRPRYTSCVLFISDSQHRLTCRRLPE